MATDEDKVKHNARRRARKSASSIGAEIAIVYEKPIEEWDDQELARGRPRDKDGGFKGRRPTWLTPALQAERQRRLRQLLSDELATFAADALRTIHSVMTDKRMDESGKPVVPPAVKLDAGKYLVDQFMGKATTTIDVQSDNALYELMGGILVNRDGSPAHPDYQVIEGTTVEDDPSDGEDDDSPVLIQYRDIDQGEN